MPAEFVQTRMARLLYSCLLLACPLAAGEIPLEKLPAHVEAPAGRLTLFADYKDVRDGHVALYLVNRTGTTQVFESQDGKLYLKLQAKEPDGTWARAQGHVFSWCGNSYFIEPALPDGHFWRLRGLFPAKGEKREVRFRHYGTGLVSNAGEGRIDPAEIEKCRGDSFAARFGDFATVAAIADGKVQTTKRDHIRVRPFAAYHLRRFKHARCVALLERLLREEDPQVRRNAVTSLGSLGDLAEPARPAMKRLAESDPDEGVRDAAKRALGVGE